MVLTQKVGEWSLSIIFWPFHLEGITNYSTEGDAHVHMKNTMCDNKDA